MDDVGNAPPAREGGDSAGRPVKLEPGKKPYRLPTLEHTAPSRIAAVLAMDQLGVARKEIARREHMSTASVYQIIKQGDHIDPAIVERVKQRYAAHWWITGERALQGITEDKIKDASASQLGVLAAISTDKALLLEGKPTMRIEHQTANDRESDERIKELEAELEGWKDGNTINVEGIVGGRECIPPTV